MLNLVLLNWIFFYLFFSYHLQTGRSNARRADFFSSCALESMVGPLLPISTPFRLPSPLFLHHLLRAKRKGMQWNRSRFMEPFNSTPPYHPHLCNFTPSAFVMNRNVTIGFTWRRRDKNGRESGSLMQNGRQRRNRSSPFAVIVSYHQIRMMRYTLIHLTACTT